MKRTNSAVALLALVAAITSASHAQTLTDKSLTNEKGQVWNGIVSVRAVAEEKSVLLLTLKIARISAGAQIK